MGARRDEVGKWDIKKRRRQSEETFRRAGKSLKAELRDLTCTLLLITASPQSQHLKYIYIIHIIHTHIQSVTAWKLLLDDAYLTCGRFLYYMYIIYTKICIYNIRLCLYISFPQLYNSVCYGFVLLTIYSSSCLHFDSVYYIYIHKSERQFVEDIYISIYKCCN